MAVNFSFIKGKKVRQVAERDYYELLRLKNTKVPKARMILAGGIIEAILLDAVGRRERWVRAKLEKSLVSPPKGKVKDWRLFELMQGAEVLKLWPDTVGALAASVREFRNLVHPGKEVDGDYEISFRVARIAEDVLDMFIDHLRKAHRKHSPPLPKPVSTAKAEVAINKPGGDKGRIFDILSDGDWHQISDLQTKIKADANSRVKSLRYMGKKNGQWQVEIDGGRARMVKLLAATAAAGAGITGKTFGEVHPLKETIGDGVKNLEILAKMLSERRSP